MNCSAGCFNFVELSYSDLSKRKRTPRRAGLAGSGNDTGKKPPGWVHIDRPLGSVFAALNIRRHLDARSAGGDRRGHCDLRPVIGKLRRGEGAGRNIHDHARLKPVGARARIGLHQGLDIDAARRRHGRQRVAARDRYGAGACQGRRCCQKRNEDEKGGSVSHAHQSRSLSARLQPASPYCDGSAVGAARTTRAFWLISTFVCQKFRVVVQY